MLIPVLVVVVVVELVVWFNGGVILSSSTIGVKVEDDLVNTIRYVSPGIFILQPLLYCDLWCNF